ncbi:MAG: vWA domain-containing protein [Myxococcota bacterium]
MPRSVFASLLAFAACTDIEPLADDLPATSEPPADPPYEAPTECPDVDGIPYSVPQQPNVMLVIDRSGSMLDGTPSRWEQLVSLVPYLDGVEQASRLGLTLFPAPDAGWECDVDGGIVVPISAADDADVTIGEWLEASPPAGGTPMAAAIDLVTAEGRLQDPYRDNVAVLLSDGEPQCDRDVSAVKRSVRALVSEGAVPVELFVIGFGVSQEADEALAAIAAEASSTTEGENYFTADSVEELLDRVYRVAATLDACTFTLDEDVDPEELVVHAAGREVLPCEDADCLDGYVYDPAQSTVQLAAGTCRDLGGAECPDVTFERL